MPEITKQAASASMALFYITVGALTCVWTVIYYIYVNRHGDGSEIRNLWCYGFFATGIVLMVIGFAVGRIGRSARQAEVTSTLPMQQQPVVAPPPAPVPTAPVAGQVVVPAQPVAQVGAVAVPAPTTQRR